MRKVNKLQDFFEKHFQDHPNAQIDELTDFVALYADKPDVKKLIRQSHRNIVNRIVRKIKNDTGIRRVYADRKNDIYSNVEIETDLNILNNIRKDSHYKQTGNKTTYDFVTKRMAELSGQTVLQFEEENSFEKSASN
jgi:hypothetical protein